jgi:hypothetical protein
MNRTTDRYNKLIEQARTSEDVIRFQRLHQKEIIDTLRTIKSQQRIGRIKPDEWVEAWTTSRALVEDVQFRAMERLKQITSGEFEARLKTL